MAHWVSLAKKGHEKHGLDYDEVIGKFAQNRDMTVVVDCVHGSSRVQIDNFFKGVKTERLHFLRKNSDYTFGGIAPEPSAANMEMARSFLNSRPEPLKLGVIIDPDADRIRFTDGTNDINMNQFGAMAYHFLHEVKKKKGLVAKTVATSNFANAMAVAFQEEIFEPRVGFKEFKPVINKALVCFEESDGISVIGHTPEKDAYIGLLLALDMVTTLGQNLGGYLAELQENYGHYFPEKDGLAVSKKGEALNRILAGLDVYQPGSRLKIAGLEKVIAEVISIDGHKIILDDGSWIMIRPSGTEPKVRFYVEARSEKEKEALFKTAKDMLRQIGL